MSKSLNIFFPNQKRTFALRKTTSNSNNMQFFLSPFLKCWLFTFTIITNILLLNKIHSDIRTLTPGLKFMKQKTKPSKSCLIIKHNIGALELNYGSWTSIWAPVKACGLVLLGKSRSAHSKLLKWSWSWWASRPRDILLPSPPQPGCCHTLTPAPASSKADHIHTLFSYAHTLYGHCWPPEEHYKHKNRHHTQTAHA